MALPPARGGQALPVHTPKPQGPRATRRPRIKQPSIDEQANTQALGMFRTALSRLQAATPAVDSAAIYAPYRASEQIAGQLGTGLQQSLATAGQNAQEQYNRGLGQAQSQAAQFGISAGAGANPTALQNTGTAAIASQSQAQQAAAPQAAAQWQQLLERTGAAKVSAAELARQQGLTGAQQSLSANLPSLISNQQDKLFQRQTARQNLGLAYSQLSQKDRQYAQQYGLDAYKARASAGASAARTNATQRSTNERIRHDLATERQTAQKAAAATKAGIKNVSQATSALKGGSSSGTKLTPKGWAVTVGVLDPNTGDPTGDTKVIKLPDKRKLPTGPGGTAIYKFISAKTNYEKVPAAAGGFSWARYKHALGILKASNPGVPVSELMPILGPTPKTKK